jgi:hypothetical protein
MSLDQVLKIVQIGAYSLGAISAGGAVWVAWSNARREGARWVENL